MRLLSLPLRTRKGEDLGSELTDCNRRKGLWDSQNKTKDLVLPKGDATHFTLPSKSVLLGFAQVEPLRISMSDWGKFLFSQMVWFWQKVS